MNTEMTKQTLKLPCTKPAIAILVGKVAILGCGSLGTHLLDYLTRKSHQNIIATRRNRQALAALKRKYNIEVSTDNLYAASQAETIVLGVKPKYIYDIAKEISEHTTGKLVVSLAAAVSIDKLQKSLNNEQARVARVMTGLYIGNETACYSLDQRCTETDQRRLKYLFGQSSARVTEEILAHRTMIACATGLKAKQVHEDIKAITDLGMDARLATECYATTLQQLAQAILDGKSGEQILDEVGMEGSFTRALETKIQESGFYDLMRELIELTVKKCS